MVRYMEYVHNGRYYEDWLWIDTDDDVSDAQAYSTCMRGEGRYRDNSYGAEATQQAAESALDAAHCAP